MKRSAIWLAVLLLALAFSGCDDDSSDDANDRSGEAFFLTMEGGNLQSGFVGEELIDKLFVSARYADGAPAADREIAIEILLGEGEGRAEAELHSIDSKTDENGLASCRVLLGDRPGMLRVRAGSPAGDARPGSAGTTCPVSAGGIYAGSADTLRPDSAGGIRLDARVAALVYERHEGSAQPVARQNGCGKGAA